MTNYERVKLYLEFGFKVKCQLESKVWVIYSSVTTKGLRVSAYSSDINDCLGTLGATYSNKNEIDEQTFLSITPIIEKPKMYEVGDLVDIAEEAGEIGSYNSWLGCQKEMVGQKGFKVKEKNDTAKGIYYKVFCTNSNDYYVFPAWCLTPHIPEQDDEVAKAIKVLEKAGRIKDGKIISL